MAKYLKQSFVRRVEREFHMLGEITHSRMVELIDAYQQVADGELYSDNTRRAALRKVNSLREELGLDHVELKQSSKAPKNPVTTATTTPFNKWFK